MPWSGWNRKLLDKSEGLVARVLVPFAGDTAVNEVFNVSTDVRPGVLSSEQVECMILAGVSCSQVVMLELENAGAEVASFWVAVRNVNVVVDEKEAGVRDGIVGVRWKRGGKGFLSELVGLEAVEDIFVELAGIDFVESLVDYWF